MDDYPSPPAVPGLSDRGQRAFIPIYFRFEPTVLPAIRRDSARL